MVWLIIGIGVGYGIMSIVMTIVNMIEIKRHDAMISEIVDELIKLTEYRSGDEHG